MVRVNSWHPLLALFLFSDPCGFENYFTHLLVSYPYACSITSCSRHLYSHRLATFIQTSFGSDRSTAYPSALENCFAA